MSDRSESEHSNTDDEEAATTETKDNNKQAAPAEEEAKTVPAKKSSAPKSPSKDTTTKSPSKSLGKRPKAQYTAKRHKKHKKEREDLLKVNLRKPVLRRLARRGGVKRLTKETYDESRRFIREHLLRLLGSAQEITRYRKRRTLATRDLVEALRAQGYVIYGFA